MRILSVDTTGAHSSVAVLEGEKLAGVLGVSGERPRHAEGLLPSIDYLLERLDRSVTDIEGYAVCVGPGSFTGVRIGIAGVEGLAYASDRPVVGVSALEATAFRFRFVRGPIVAFIDAYRGEVYGAAFRSDDGVLSPVGPAVCAPPERFLASLAEPPALVAGSATLRHRDLLEEIFPEEDVVVAPPSFFLAEEIARLGAERLLSGTAAVGGGLEALYIRPSEAERNREKSTAL